MVEIAVIVPDFDLSTNFEVEIGRPLRGVRDINEYDGCCCVYAFYCSRESDNYSGLEVRINSPKNTLHGKEVLFKM